MLVFACISPHPPIILPTVGSSADREKVKNTIQSLEKLGNELAKAKPDTIVVSSPHPDWGIEVPLHFLMEKLKRQKQKLQVKIQNYIQINEFENFEIEKFIGNCLSAEVLEQAGKLEIGNSTVFPILTGFESPRKHYDFGKKIASVIPKEKRWCWIASGDMSHRLKKDGPYGLHPSGAKFDAEFIRLLKKKDIQGILNLDPKLTEEAGECGVRSFCMLLGALEQAKVNWQPKILSYEGPFGVGYLVANIRINENSNLFHSD